MKTLYLHIGTPKTGTTSLQNMMADNRSQLESHGICYPDFGFRYHEIGINRNAHFLISPAQNPDGSFDQTRPSPDYEAGLDMLPPLVQKFDTIILSDEGIFSGSQFRPDFWGKLKNDLQIRGLSLKIIMYLRRQDLFLESMYAQKIRERNCSCRFAKFVNTKLCDNPLYELNYKLFLDRVASVVGRENLFVHVFEKDRFLAEGKTLYSDFLQIFGLSQDEFIIGQEINNPCLGGEYLEIKRILNKLPANRPERHLITQSMKALTGIKHPGYTPGSRFSYFTPEGRKEFLARYEASNEQVARTYLHREDGVLFYEQAEEYPVYATNDHDLLYCTILTYGNTLEQMQSEIKSLRREIKALRESSFSFRAKRLCKKVLTKLHLQR